MPAFTPGAPEPNEYKPAFGGYIAKAQSVTDPVDSLERQLDEVLAELRALDPAKRLHRYAAGKWSIQEVLGHLIDTERIFAYRALRIARADQTPLPGFEENDYAVAAESDSADWNGLVAEFEHLRRSNILMFRSLPHAAWTRIGTASGAPMSVRAMAYIMYGHVAHHLDILRQRYLAGN